MFEKRTETINELVKHNIKYELALPGKIMTANTDLQNDGVLVWNVDMFRFLADDYTLTAESRAVNLWAFLVTLLLVVISVCCFVMLHSSAKNQQKTMGRHPKANVVARLQQLFFDNP